MRPVVFVTALVAAGCAADTSFVDFVAGETNRQRFACVNADNLTHGRYGLPADSPHTGTDEMAFLDEQRVEAGRLMMEEGPSSANKLPAMRAYTRTGVFTMTGRGQSFAEIVPMGPLFTTRTGAQAQRVTLDLGVDEAGQPVRSHFALWRVQDPSFNVTQLQELRYAENITTDFYSAAATVVTPLRLGEDGWKQGLERVRSNFLEYQSTDQTPLDWVDHKVANEIAQNCRPFIQDAEFWNIVEYVAANAPPPRPQ